MLETIKECKKCGLCNNQKPLLDNKKMCEVIWVGLSAKKVVDIDSDIPLSNDTNSGSLINQVENACSDIKTYRTNIVKCLPLDDNQKLRYPKTEEINRCFQNLVAEIDEFSPKLVFLLGQKVSLAVQKNFGIIFEKSKDYNYSWKKYENTYYIPIHHPSYISVYKRKYVQSYIKGIKKVIDELMGN